MLFLYVQTADYFAVIIIAVSMSSVLAGMWFLITLCLIVLISVNGGSEL